LEDGGAVVSVRGSGGARSNGSGLVFAPTHTEGGRWEVDGVRGERRLCGVLEDLVA
jgi:hypothetical protein